MLKITVQIRQVWRHPRPVGLGEAAADAPKQGAELLPNSRFEHSGEFRPTWRRSALTPPVCYALTLI
jgi:hypothetical protein